MNNNNNEQRWTAARLAASRTVSAPARVDAAGLIDTNVTTKRVLPARQAPPPIPVAAEPRARRPSVRLVRPAMTVTQKFFVDGEAQEARQWEGSPLAQDDLSDKEALAFDSFDSVPRRRSPVLIVAVLVMVGLGTAATMKALDWWGPASSEAAQVWWNWRARGVAMSHAVTRPLGSVRPLLARATEPLNEAASRTHAGAASIVRPSSSTSMAASAPPSSPIKPEVVPLAPAAPSTTSTTIATKDDRADRVKTPPGPRAGRGSNAKLIHLQTQVSSPTQAPAPAPEPPLVAPPPEVPVMPSPPVTEPTPGPAPAPPITEPSPGPAPAPPITEPSPAPTLPAPTTPTPAPLATDPPPAAI
jgi:hypothetical protein